MSKKYTPEERLEALKLAREIGNKAAAERLDINLDTLYTWIGKSKSGRHPELPPPTEEELKTENERLKKELYEKEQEVEILQEALGFFVKSRKK